MEDAQGEGGFGPQRLSLVDDQEPVPQRPLVGVGQEGFGEAVEGHHLFRGCQGEDEAQALPGGRAHGRTVAAPQRLRHHSAQCGQIEEGLGLVFTDPAEGAEIGLDPTEEIGGLEIGAGVGPVAGVDRNGGSLDCLFLPPADRLQEGLEMGRDAVRRYGRAPGRIAGKAHPLRRDRHVKPLLMGLGMGSHDHLAVGETIIAQIDRVADRAGGEDRHFLGAILLDEEEVGRRRRVRGRNATGPVGRPLRFGGQTGHGLGCGGGWACLVWLVGASTGCVRHGTRILAPVLSLSQVLRLANPSRDSDCLESRDDGIALATGTDQSSSNSPGRETRGIRLSIHGTAQEQRLGQSASKAASELPHGVGDHHLLSAGGKLWCEETPRLVEQRGTGIGGRTGVHRDQIDDGTLVIKGRQDEAVGDPMAAQGTLGIAREGSSGIDGTIADAVCRDQVDVLQTHRRERLGRTTIRQPPAGKVHDLPKQWRRDGWLRVGVIEQLRNAQELQRVTGCMRDVGEDGEQCGRSSQGPQCRLHGVHPVSAVARQDQVMRRQRGNQGRQDRGRLNYSNTWDTVLG